MCAEIQSHRLVLLTNLCLLKVVSYTGTDYCWCVVLNVFQIKSLFLSSEKNNEFVCFCNCISRNIKCQESERILQSSPCCSFSLVFIHRTKSNECRKKNSRSSQDYCFMQNARKFLIYFNLFIQCQTPVGVVMIILHLI